MASAAAPVSAALPKDALAVVNGVPITQREVDLALKTPAHKEEDEASRFQQTLDALIQRELLRQKALELGLDHEARYLEKRQAFDMQVRSFERTELPDALFRHLESEAKVTDADGQAWFDQNKARVQTEYHIEQILLKNEAAIHAAADELKAGKPFEEVAKVQFPNLPPRVKTPWDLGFLNWAQIPPQWRPTLETLAEGTNSEIITGPSNRFWLIRVIERRQKPDLTYDMLKAPILERLRGQSVETAQAKLTESLKAKASIRMIPKAATPGTAPTDE